MTFNSRRRVAVAPFNLGIGRMPNFFDSPCGLPRSYSYIYSTAAADALFLPSTSKKKKEVTRCTRRLRGDNGSAASRTKVWPVPFNTIAAQLPVYHLQGGRKRDGSCDSYNYIYYTFTQSLGRDVQPPMAKVYKLPAPARVCVCHVVY